MKKICGALVVGLMITTNVFASEKECDEFLVKTAYTILEIKGLKFENNPQNCKIVKAIVDSGFNIGHGSGKLAMEAYKCPNLSTELPDNSRVRELEWRLIECNFRKDWGY